MPQVDAIRSYRKLINKQRPYLTKTHYLYFVRKPPAAGGVPVQSPSIAELKCFLCYWPEQDISQQTHYAIITLRQNDVILT